MPWSGTLRKSMFHWFSWLWAGPLDALGKPSLGKAALGGGSCLRGAEYVISDLVGPREDLMAPFWFTEETGAFT